MKINGLENVAGLIRRVQISGGEKSIFARLKVFLVTLHGARISMARLVILSILSTFGAKGDTLEQFTNEPVLLLKHAVCSQVDVDKIIFSSSLVDREIISQYAKTTTPVDSTPQWFEGTSSGANFCLRRIPDPNSTNSVILAPYIAGQIAGKSYQLNENALAYTLEATNPIARFTALQRTALNQVLNMGLVHYDPSSLTWTNDIFQAKRTDGALILGLLETSNGIPISLDVRLKNGTDPFWRIKYSYLTNAGSLSGYPNNVVVSRYSNGVFLPSTELNIFEIHLATRPIHEALFDPSNYVTAKIKFTNIYSNGFFYNFAKSGRLVKLPALHPRGVDPEPSPRARVVVIVICGVTTLAFVTLLLKQKKA